MFADPQTLTVNGVAVVLQRVNQDGFTSEYRLRSSSALYTLRIRNTSYRDKKRNVNIDRHVVEFRQEIYPVAPATSSTVRKTYMVVENQEGDTLTDPVHYAAALCAWATASTNANLTKLMSFES